MLGDAAPLGRLLRADPGAVHARDAMGRAPLHLAAECRWTDVTETLLAAGGRPRRAGRRRRDRARDMAGIRLAEERTGEETRQRWGVRHVRRAGRNGLAADAGCAAPPTDRPTNRDYPVQTARVLDELFPGRHRHGGRVGPVEHRRDSPAPGSVDSSGGLGDECALASAEFPAIVRAMNAPARLFSLFLSILRLLPA